MGSTLSMMKESKLQKKKGKEDRKEGNNFCRNRKCNLIFFKKEIFYEHILESLIVSLIQKKIALFLVLISEKNDEMLLFI